MESIDSTPIPIQELQAIRSEIQKLFSHTPFLHRIEREIDKAEIFLIIKERESRSQVKLPKDLKESLSDRYYFSVKKIEEIAYSCE
ncbi:MAG TPA: hypothetical protein DD671_10610 [Balneolaceae bacterium]|nr:hypothetical protein [Balneolaceae bacterium]